jgi:hypothetical protein
MAVLALAGKPFNVERRHAEPAPEGKIPSGKG